MINDESLQKQDFNRTLLLKAVVFFSVLLAAVLGVLFLKLILNSAVPNESVFAALLPAAVESALVLAAFLVYLVYTRSALVSSQKDLYAIGIAVVLSYSAQVFFSLLGFFVTPMALAAFIIVPIAKRRDAFVSNIFCNLLSISALLTEFAYASVAGTASHAVLDILIVFTLGIAGGSVAAYTLSNKTGRFGYVIKGLIIGAATYALIVLYYVFQGIYGSFSDMNYWDVFFTRVLPFAAIGAFSPVLIGTLLQPVLERTFNLITDAWLVDLTDHNSPLIKRLRTEAAGTFSHSLSVASFAEICASAIGENPYLARTAAYYHDVGKLDNPEYYMENQTQVNLHDELLPEVSVEIIRAHTTDGLNLCEKYRIPQEVARVTVEHHGTLLIPAFYEKAKRLTDSPVDADHYSYHGVTPTTKIAAIIMICDASDAAIRAIDAPDAEKVEKLLSDIIEARILAGQFSNCDISLKDLEIIKKTIFSAYGGLYHKRMKYPGWSGPK